MSESHRKGRHLTSLFTSCPPQPPSPASPLLTSRSLSLSLSVIFQFFVAHLYILFFGWRKEREREKRERWSCDALMREAWRCRVTGASEQKTQGLPYLLDKARQWPVRVLRRIPHGLLQSTVQPAYVASTSRELSLSQLAHCSLQWIIWNHEMSCTTLRPVL